MESIIDDLSNNVQAIWSLCEIALTHATSEDLLFPQRSADNCKLVQTILEEKNLSILKVKEALLIYAQALLDQTYYDECELVNKEFELSHTEDSIQNIIDNLTRPFEYERRLTSVISDSEVKTDFLTVDIRECLCWRCGALSYMYCRTIAGNRERLEANKAQVIKFLKLGVFFLMKMLNMRKMSAKEELIYNNASVAELVKQGIYSDTHALANAYAGEMCYWHWSYTKKVAQERETAVVSVEDYTSKINDYLMGNRTSNSMETAEALEFDSRAIGMTLLDQYIAIVEGPLKFYGWETTHIKKLLSELKQN